jgi:putative hydroxymethylpyrimidine transport system ATP-binding protein
LSAPPDQQLDPQPAAPAPEVRIDDARVDYDGQPLVDGLSLRLEAGRWTVLLGPSGVGKTTLLRLIAGLAHRQHASARLSCDDGGALATRVSYMAQQDLLLPWLSVEDNVLLGPRLRGEPIGAPQRARARALLEDLGIAASSAALPATLSGGMRQRAALARTLYEDRPVVLMDEPFSSLDAITRHRLQSLAAAKLSGRTVLLITHDPMEALCLGHAVHVMQGRPATLGPALRPAGDTPRPAQREDVVAACAELLARLDRAGSSA